ncbi:MAG: thioesterase family protein [Oscillibacter sp.]|nr:thioesterase family protein [Oscillibacter sp.]
MVIIGTKCQIETVVTQDQTAQAIGSGALPVFGTPFMTALMENAAMTCLQAFLEDGQGSVGTYLDVKHSAPTPVGMKVTAEAEIYDANDRKVMFRVRAWDEKGPIGEGTHTRFIIDNEKFLAKCNAKLDK